MNETSDPQEWESAAVSSTLELWDFFEQATWRVKECQTDEMVDVEFMVMATDGATAVEFTKEGAIELAEALLEAAGEPGGD